ncbi:MAG: hypothetical protein V3S93_00555 [Methyloceanibacter sp.]|jgi:hypothetical protein
MLTGLSAGFRFRIAVALSAFAALCFVLLPSATLAFGPDANLAECFFQADAVDHHGTGDHHDGAEARDLALPVSQHHGDDAPGPVGHGIDCCDAFCSSALLADDGELANREIAAPPHFLAREPQLFSRIPELPDRPPNSLLVV